MALNPSNSSNLEQLALKGLTTGIHTLGNELQPSMSLRCYQRFSGGGTVSRHGIYRLRRRSSQLFVMRVTDPADFSFHVDRTQRPEASRAGVDTKVAGEVLAIGCRRCVKDGVCVQGAVDAEVEVGHSTVAGRCQHLGQHRHHAVFVL